MKRLFISVFALATFAGCTDKLDDEIAIEGGKADVAQESKLMKVYAEVDVARTDDTRATYGDALDARWEENDAIAVFQEHTSYGSNFSTVSTLGILKGAGTASAKFSGEISVGTTDPRRFHIAYPKEAVSFSIIDAVTAESEVQYSDNKATGGHNYSATGSYRHTYTNNVRLTVPATQSGKWEPYMFASTPEAVVADRIGTQRMTVLTGAVAIRVFEHDGTTPKRVKKIVVSANSALVGDFTGSSVSYGSTGTVTGDDSGWYTAFNKSDAQKKAVANLEAKAQATVPTDVVCERALELDGFEGGSTIVTLDDLQNIDANGDGDYIYYINVAPVAVDGLTITLIDENNFEITRTASARTLVAGVRSGYNIRWDDASISMDEPTSWYDETSADFTSMLAGNTLYCNNLKIGGADVGQIVKMGVDIDGAQYPLEPTTFAEQLTYTLASGEYTVFAYAEVKLSDGSVKALQTEPKRLYVTAVPKLSCTVNSSYESSDGNISKSNELDGYTLWFKGISLNDEYLRDNLTDGNLTVAYGSNNDTAAFVDSRTYENLTPAKYGCYVEVKLSNGYALRSAACDISVTGIPYALDVTKNDGTWSTSGSVSWNQSSSVQFGKGGGAGSMTKQFHLPADTDVKISSAGSVHSATIRTTFTLSCSSTTLVSVNPSRNKTDDYNYDNVVTMLSSNSVVMFDNSYGLGATGANLASFRVEYSN